MYKHTCTMENATKFAEWIKTRGGVAVWRSADLGNPGASWSTPAMIPEGTEMNDGTVLEEDRPYPRPTWQAESQPSMVITNPAEIGVSLDKEVKRFHVAVRRGSGLSFELTAASSRKLRAEVEKAGEGAYHVFDYGDYKNAVIMAPERTESLADFIQRHAA